MPQPNPWQSYRQVAAQTASPGQLVLMRSGTNAQGLPSSGPKDVVGVFTSEAEAQSALTRLATSHSPVGGPPTRPQALRG